MISCEEQEADEDFPGRKHIAKS
jgi:hypothetical protein